MKATTIAMQTMKGSTPIYTSAILLLEAFGVRDLGLEVPAETVKDIEVYPFRWTYQGPFHRECLQEARRSSVLIC